MTAHDQDAGLDAHSRAALLRWIDTLDADAPSGFADGVLARMEQQARGARLALAADEPLLPAFVEVPTAAPSRRRSLRRWLTIGASVLAAAALVLLIARNLRAEAEHGERTDRLAALELPPSASLLELRAAALATLQAECTPCHSGTSSDAVTGALEVFDVEDPRWYLSMSERQLGVAIRRIDGAVETAEREGFRAYVDAEIAHRRSSASAPVTGGRARTGT
jgi:hypothetical protein